MAAPQTTTTFETTPLSDEEDPYLMERVTDPAATFLMHIALGFSGGNYLERDKYQQGPYLALRYIPLTEDLPTWDYQVEVQKDNLVGLAVGRRWYCCPQDSYLPYARVAANLFLEGAGELAGIAEIRRWRARAALGIGAKVTWEVGLGIAITGPDLYTQLGYNFSF